MKAHSGPSCRTCSWRAVGLAALALVSLGCALLSTPTPIAWITSTPTPPATEGPPDTATVGPTMTATPAATTPLAPTDTVALPTATRPLISPTPAPERIRFATGATQASLEGSLPATGSRAFVLGIQGGQFVEISATIGAEGPGLRFSLVGVDGTVMKPMGEPFIRAVAPRTQDYVLELLSDVGETDFRMSIMIPVRVSFAPGGTSAEVTGTLPADGSRHYAIRVLAGQTMKLETVTSEGQVILIVYGADGTVLQSDHGGFRDFEGPVPTTQDYLIHVRAVGTGGARYTMRVTIPPP